MKTLRILAVATALVAMPAWSQTPETLARQADALRATLPEVHVAAAERVQSVTRRFGGATVASANDEPYALHMLPYIPGPGRFPQGFLRIANLGTTDDTVTMILVDDDGALYHDVAVDVPWGQTVHVNSNDIAGRTGKAGVRVTTIRSPDAPVYWTIARSGTSTFIRAFTRSKTGFINDVGNARGSSSFEGRQSTLLGTANPGSNRSIVGELRILNFELEAIDVDLLARDDHGYGSGLVTCSIPESGALILETLDLELGTAPGCVGAWGDGAGKWAVLTESDGLHFSTSSLRSVELGILANISDARALRFEYD